MSLVTVRQDNASHWYTPDGQPFHEIECASKPGEMRPVNVRDARKLGLLPSVTNVLLVIEKRPLTLWKIEQGILAALTLPKLESESLDHYAARVAQDAEQESKKAADFGTRVHAQADRFITTGLIDLDDVETAPFAQCFARWWADNDSMFTGFIVDFKTQGRAESPMNFYDEWCWQLAAYQDALSGSVPAGVTTERIVTSQRGYGGRLDYAHDGGGQLGCASVAISSKTPGLIEVKKWSTEEVENGKRIFFAALELWKLLKSYDPTQRKETIDVDDQRINKRNLESPVRRPR